MIITNKLGLPQPIVNSVARDYQYKDKRYSVTSILKSPRETLLQRRHNNELIQDVSDSAWLIFGNCVHDYLANHLNDDVELLSEEKQIYTTKNGYVLSGIFDLYNKVTHAIIDYKTASVWKHVFGNIDDYVKQIRMYGVILRQNGLEVSYGEIVDFLKDWSPSEKLRSGGNYPSHAINVWNSEILTDNILNATQDEIEAYFEDIEKLEKLSDDELPLCKDEDRFFGNVSTYVVIKEGNVRATISFKTEEEAKQYIVDKNLSKTHKVVFREAIEKKCMEYCSVCSFCNHYKEKYAKVFLHINNQIRGFIDEKEAQEVNKTVYDGTGEIIERL